MNDNKNLKSLFLEAMDAALENRKIHQQEPVTEETWRALFKLATSHAVLPMIYQSVAHTDVFAPYAAVMGLQIKRQSMYAVMNQTQRSQDFLQIYRALAAQGLEPIVVKGLVCRNLYPQPDQRISNDEDLFIPAEEYTTYRDALLREGLIMNEDEHKKEQEEHSHEIVMHRPTTGLTLELHRDLIDPELTEIADMNMLFKNSFEHTVIVNIEGVDIRTLSYTDHLLFLILHAFKHFVIGGFGIRQVADIIIFGEKYGNEIDWHSVLERCRQFRADVFAATLFQIGQKYLSFHPEQACYPEEWQAIAADGENLLDDLLDAGIYGSSTLSRKHSSGMTLHALQTQSDSKKSNSGLIHTIFPSASKLKGRYPYLEKHPGLLPVAWCSRILQYRRETAGADASNSASESIRIGKERIELLREYGIID